MNKNKKRFYQKTLGSMLASMIGLCCVPNYGMALPDFTSQEIQVHNMSIRTITETASRCLEDIYADHVDFFQKWKVSKYYGDRNPQLSSPLLRRAQLRNFGAPERLESELEPISCIGLTIRCLGEGFHAAHQDETWKKIYDHLLKDKKLYGTDLQILLQKLGWKVLYWNPDPSQNRQWDQEDRSLNPPKPNQVWNPVWGGHESHYARVKRNQTYFGIKVDDAETLVGFNTTIPESFKNFPFFIGTAHAGYHVFPGYNGKVIEAHSMRKLNAPDNLEVSSFNPLAPQGGPRWTRSERYRSGIIVVPPEPR